MKRSLCLASLALPAALMMTVVGAQRFREDFAASQTETVQKTLTFSSATALRELVVDNIDGGIVVTGYDGDTVQLEVVKTLRGRSKEDIELARTEVQLQISEKNNRIELFVDGPFRCKDGSMNTRRLPYRVTFEYQIRVPRACALTLSTVNHGEIRVENVDGRFDVQNVNGKIRMAEVGGSGRAHTINGGLTVLFSRNPSGDSSFGSLNGDVDVAFRPGMSADFWFKTFNGSAYTDFELTPLPQPAAEQVRRDGKYVYKSNRFVGARVGRGGPQIKFDAFNGSIHVTSR